MLVVTSGLAKHFRTPIKFPRMTNLDPPFASFDNLNKRFNFNPPLVLEIVVNAQLSSLLQT